MDQEVPWRQVEIFQVDERVAPAGSPDRNLTHLRESLVARVPVPPESLHAMPVEASDLAAAAASYARTLETVPGAPSVLELVHLGLAPMATPRPWCRTIRCSSSRMPGSGSQAAPSSIGGCC